jgi:mercuric reductase
MPEECCAVPFVHDDLRPDGAQDTRPDVLIIGVGSAAFSAAITAAELGARVVMAGEGTIGGTCVNIGCVPSKALIRAMQAVHDARRAGRFDGVSATAAVSHWKALVEQKRALVSDLRHAKYEDLLRQYPTISYVKGRAAFTGNGTEMAVNGALYRARKVILAVGASPSLPPIAGIQSVPVLDSTKALDLEDLPESLLVVGGGFIGCELAQMFARAGVKVTICCRRRLLPHAEPEASRALSEYLRAEGIVVCQGVTYRKIEARGKGIALTCQTPAGETVIEAAQVLAAAGRQPNTSGLGLDRVGIALNEAGGIAVDAYMQTTHPDVYAAGDATGQDMFVYMAAYGAKVAARNALDGNRHAYSNSAMPCVIFTDPQVASVGWTEAEARAHGHDVMVSLLGLDQVARFLVARDTRGLIKLVAEAGTGKLLGATIVAPEAGDSIQTVAMALRAGLTAGELADVIFPYLTGVEAIKLAAQAFEKDVSKLSCCAG